MNETVSIWYVVATFISVGVLLGGVGVGRVQASLFMFASNYLLVLIILAVSLIK